MTNPFYGRERELGILKELLEMNVARLVVVRGRRRIGRAALPRNSESLLIVIIHL